MEKIKISIASGSVLEKPLITAFKNNNITYVVLDNEINGTMGLPIILVSKLENDKLVKIMDKSPEWETVKESLRNIIAGNPIEYTSVNSNLNADELFFSQLTLPVASFDALKNNYKPMEAPGEPALEEQAQPAPTEQETVSIPNPNEVLPVQPSMPEPPMPTSETAEETAEQPVDVTPQPVQVDTIPQAEPVMPIAPAEPAPVNNQVVANVAPVEPTSEPAQVPVDFTADKEAFLKACENMFDALVAKFKN